MIRIPAEAVLAAWESPAAQGLLELGAFWLECVPRLRGEAIDIEPTSSKATPVANGAPT